LIPRRNSLRGRRSLKIDRKPVIGEVVVNREVAQLSAGVALRMANSLRNRDGKPALPTRSYVGWNRGTLATSFTHHYTAADIARERLSMLSEVLESMIDYGA